MFCRTFQPAEGQLAVSFQLSAIAKRVVASVPFAGGSVGRERFSQYVRRLSESCVHREKLMADSYSSSSFHKNQFKAIWALRTAKSRAKRPWEKSWRQAVYTTSAQETASAETTKRRVTPSTHARRALLRIPSWRLRLCGRPAPRATFSVLFPRAGRGACRLLFALLDFSCALFPVGALGGIFLCGLLRALLAVVGGVEARALERDTDGMENFPDRGAALDAGRKGVFGELLHHVEDVPVFTLVFVGRHPASIISTREYRLYRLDRFPVLLEVALTRDAGRGRVLPNRSHV